MKAPERIWVDPGAWEIVAAKTRVEPDYDVQYVRKDASDAAIAAARAEGVREGMLKAAEIADAHEKRWNDTAYDRRQNGRDDNFACACASASTHIGIEIRAAAEAQP